MLPSTGYFKGISCPFYDSGLCERPYCHFRHVKRDVQSLSNDAIESGAMLQQLVSEAVKKVLQHTETSVSPKRAADSEPAEVPSKPPQKMTYNPTPIAELQKKTTEAESDDNSEQRKRHIPVPYTPRKPASLPIKRPDESNGDGKPFIYMPPPAKYLPGSNEGAKQDPYQPKGGIESTETYLPGTEREREVQQYKPVETKSSNTLNYVPSGKNTSKKRFLEYKPTTVSSKSSAPSVTYQPTPKSQVMCFSSDEDEPETKKRKLSTDLNGLDELGDEFDILGQILDEEKSKETEEVEIEGSNENKEKNTKQNQEKQSRDRQSSPNSKNEIHISVKIKSDQKELDKKENSCKDINQTQSKSRSSDKTSTDKSSSKEKEKDHKSSSKDKDKHHKTSSKDKARDHKTSSKHKDKHHSSSSKNKDDKSKDKERDHKSSSKDKESDHKSSSKDKESDHKSSSKDKERDHKSSIKDKDRERKKDKSKDKLSKDKKHSKSSDKVTKTSESSSRHSASNSSSKSNKKEERDGNKKEVYSNGPKSSHKSSKEKSGSADSKDHNENADNSDNDFDDRGVLEEEICEEESESDEEAIALECKRIFEEYVPMEKPRLIEEASKEENNSEEYIPTKKRISRTVDKKIKIVQKAPMKPDFKVSAVQKMAVRLTQIREFHAARNAANPVPDLANIETPKSTMNTPTCSTSTKIRIAHVPYASTMMNAKKTISRPEPPKSQASTSTTVQTVKKGVQRVAHMPNEKFIDRPGVLEPLASKIPANIRSTYLNMMIDECLKIYLTAPDAYARAQHEELATSKKCKAIQIYKNSAVLAVSRLRKEILECNGVKKSGTDCSTLQSLPSAITSSSGNAGSWSIENKYKKTSDNPHQFSGAKFYENISKWVLTEEQLQDNGFPRPHPSGKRGRAMIYIENKRQTPPKGIYRTCSRCKKEYTVDKRGFPSVKEECIYHPNRKYRVRGEAKYQCCSQDGTSDGCCVAPYHVYEYVDFDNLTGYIRTLPPEREVDDYGVYALDCEMCYTTQGLDLTRITVINADCKTVYETLIRPLHPIVDYNTRYSGITEEQMMGVTTTLLDVQATLLTMFNSKTILIGHSLESDCKALKLIHDTVIDTSVLFPHKMGPPFKRALRNLSSEYLKKIIQNSIEGHDSAEDATVCMELLQYKLREDLKTR